MAGVSAVEDVRGVLRREIVTLYAAGDYLPNERDLAERFGVARNTIRETMIHLEAFGLIEKTKRGAKVREPDFDPIFEVFTQHFDASPGKLEDVLNFRRIVETGAARYAAEGADAEVIARMEEANRRMGEAVTVSEAAGHDYDFHLGLVEASRNDVLLRMYRVMAVTLRFYLEVGKSQRPDTEAAVAQHNSIIEALKARDRVALAKALDIHFDHSGSVLAMMKARSGTVQP
ncbi:FCD domain-containing protein [Frigidibacter sp. MR17.14]|uniref:FadR/GntR family transcriptional regulator n=1 Tax=Frigidibacter sp. MR17.14 TaxID=3126509 RepID=UPI003012B5C2